jgi:hypothetical protein
MPIALDALVVLLFGGLIALLLWRVFAGGAPARQADSPSVKLVRGGKNSAGREQTSLVINEQVILTATDDGLRLSDYTREVERLELVAAKIATALNTGVELSRAAGRPAEANNGIAIRDLPEAASDDADGDAPSEATTEPSAAPPRSRQNSSGG